MTTRVNKSVVVDVPLSTAYDQWTQFEEFPRFMTGVEQVNQLSDDRLEWVAEIAGARRQWIAKILEQVPDRKVAWAAVEGATNAGEVTFDAISPTQTEVHLALEYEPEGALENVGDRLSVVEKQAESDLDRFKQYIESEGHATGAWRGSINEGATARAPGIEDAASSWRDSGKVGDRGWEPSASEAGDLATGGLPGTARAERAHELADVGRRGAPAGGGFVEGGLPGTARAEMAHELANGGRHAAPAGGGFVEGGLPGTARAEMAHELGVVGEEPPAPVADDFGEDRLTGTTTVGMPPETGDRGLNPTDAASGFGDPDLEEEPGVVRRDKDLS